MTFNDIYEAAKINYLKKNFTAAIKFFDLSISNKYKINNSYQYKADILYRLGEYQKLIELFDILLTMHPENISIKLKKSLIHGKLLEFHKADKILDEVLATNPESFEAHTLKGFSLFSQGNLTDSIFHFNDALSLNTNDIKANYGIALAYFALFKYEESEKHINICLKLHPSQEKFLSIKHSCLLSQGKYDEAGLLEGGYSVDLFPLLDLSSPVSEDNIFFPNLNTLTLRSKLNEEILDTLSGETSEFDDPFAD